MMRESIYRKGLFFVETIKGNKIFLRIIQKGIEIPWKDSHSDKHVKFMSIKNTNV